jgi:quercetin dioxygenase-like cupin family protein
MSWLSNRALVAAAGLAAAFLVAAPVTAKAQATSRVCVGKAGEEPGPACLVGHQNIGMLPAAPIYWNIYTFADAEAANRVRPPHGAVVEAFGRVWVFDVGAKSRALAGGTHVVDIGPLPLDTTKGEFSVEYLKSTFTPGMTAPVHVHSGPEAFYAISGASCLETPDGVQVGRGQGHSLMVRRGPPMLLMAIGQEMRQGFALILHEEGAPPTTLASDWTPKGLCPKA